MRSIRRYKLSGLSERRGTKNRSPKKRKRGRELMLRSAKEKNCKTNSRNSRRIARI